jgi:hypothetical protein
MMHPRHIGRVGGLSVGLGISALMAATPWIAVADPLPHRITMAQGIASHS